MGSGVTTVTSSSIAAAEGGLLSAGTVLGGAELLDAFLAPVRVGLDGRTAILLQLPFALICDRPRLRRHRAPTELLPRLAACELRCVLFDASVALGRRSLVAPDGRTGGDELQLTRVRDRRRLRRLVAELELLDVSAVELVLLVRGLRTGRTWPRRYSAPSYRSS